MALAPYVLPLFLSRRELTRLRVGHTWKSWVLVLFQWLIIATSCWFAVHVGAWWAYICAIFVIATRQHALAVLMHEAAHRQLARSRVRNDVLSDTFVAFPLALSTRLYRKHHMLHHRCLNEETDPDLPEARLVRSRRGWLGYTLLQLTGLGVFGIGSVGQQPFSLLTWRGLAGLNRWERVQLMVWLACVCCAIALIFGWERFALLWVVPAMTLLRPILQFRAVAEHARCKPAPGPWAARTVLAKWPERLVFAPCNINLHLAHHLYPQVPCFALGQLHRILMQRSSEYRDSNMATSYLTGPSSVLSGIVSEAPEEKSAE